MTRRTPARRAGFTLLELLLAGAITAAIALTLYSALQVGFRARRSAHAQTAAAREAAAVLDLVEGQLQSLLPPTGVLSGAFIGYALGTSGAEADSIQFYALNSEVDAAADDPLREGIHQVELVLRQDIGTPTLVRRVRRNLLATTAEEPAEETLSRRVTAFSARYYNGYSWQTEWDSAQMDNRLPMAVEVTVTVAADAERSTPYAMTRVVPISTGRPVDSVATSGTDL